MGKKSMHKKKLPNSKTKSYIPETDTMLTKKSDEDGVIIFQYEPKKSPWIFKKIKSLFPMSNGEVSKDLGGKMMTFFT